MNRKKQMIEEIAKELCPHYDNGNCYYEVTEVCECGFGCEFCWAISQVLNAGYRKIPEGAVVLTSKKDIQQFEWSKLVDKMGVIEFGEKLRKETAEKFAERLKELVADRNCNEDYEWEDVQVDGQIFIECVDEICKEISEGKV